MPQTLPRSSSRPRRGAARADGVRSRGRILDAAERLFAERGYAGTGIAAIREASGLPASSIYWHFESKDDLAAAVVERATERWVADLEASEPGPGADAEALVAWVSRSIEEASRRLPFFMRLSLLLALELGHREPALMERLRRGRERARSLVRGSIERVRALEGEPVEGRVAEEVARLTMAFSEGAFVSRLFDPNGIDPARLADDLNTAMRAIAEHRGAQETS